METENEAAALENETPRSDRDRLLFWLILAYTLGLALMVCEDLLFHTFI